MRMSIINGNLTMAAILSELQIGSADSQEGNQDISQPLLNLKPCIFTTVTPFFNQSNPQLDHLSNVVVSVTI